MHSCTHTKFVSLAKQFQKHLCKEHRKCGVIEQGKNRKIASKRKWTDREYHVQDNADVAHKARYGDPQRSEERVTVNILR